MMELAVGLLYVVGMMIATVLTYFLTLSVVLFVMGTVAEGFLRLIKYPVDEMLTDPKSPTCHGNPPCDTRRHKRNACDTVTLN